MFRFAPGARRAGALATLIALGPLVALAPLRADAFCRSTTCTGGDCERDDDGCKISGKKLQWKATCVGFSLQKDGSLNMPYEESEPALLKAFLAWTDLPCEGGGTASMAFVRLDDVTCRRAEHVFDRPNANVVLFQDNKWDYGGEGENNIAKTTVHFDAETGEIYGADIEINHAFNEFTTTDDEGGVVYDLQAVITHEVGHFIGLDHSPDFDATMNAAYGKGETFQRTLEPDDAAGACTAYPPERSGTCDPEPQGGLGDECAPVNVETKKPTTEGCSCRAVGDAEAAPRPGPAAFAALLVLAAARFGRRRRVALHRAR